MVAIDYKCYVKDIGHLPVSIEFNEDVFNPSTLDDVIVGQVNRIAWHQIDNYSEYSNLIEEILQTSIELDFLAGISCSDRSCRDPNHLCDINILCKIMTDMCVDAADVTLSKVGTYKVNRIMTLREAQQPPHRNQDNSFTSWEKPG